MVYFKVCGQVLAAEMTCCQKIFNEYYSYLMVHAQKYGGVSGSGNGETKEKTPEQTQGGDTKFN